MSIVQCQRTRLKSQAGFTLVELAIVMIIIGLLIGGVLKGQQLITNAQIAATVAQVKGIDAATTSFRDMYNSLPGDILTPTTRLPNCAAGTFCATAGNGNGTLGNTPGVIPTGANEGGVFFVHIASAGLLTGINTSGAALNATWGGSFPATKVPGGGIWASSDAGVPGDFLGVIGGGVGVPSGLWLTLLSTPAAAPGAAAGLFLTPNQSGRIDTKIDDGIPDQGTVRAFGGATCGAVGAYAESQQGKNCGLYIQIQG